MILFGFQIIIPQSYWTSGKTSLEVFSVVFPQIIFYVPLPPPLQLSTSLNCAPCRFTAYGFGFWQSDHPVTPWSTVSFPLICVFVTFGVDFHVSLWYISASYFCRKCPWPDGRFSYLEKYIYKGLVGRLVHHQFFYMWHQIIHPQFYLFYTFRFRSNFRMVKQHFQDTLSRRLSIQILLTSRDVLLVVGCAQLISNISGCCNKITTVFW